MAADGCAEEQLEALRREAEALKLRLEEERQKLNDVTLTAVAARLEPITFPSLKPRRILKGHQSKVLCVDWASDRRRLVSSAQDGKLLVWDAFTASKEAQLALPTSWLLACAFAPGGSLVAAGGLDNKVTVFSLGEEEAGAAGAAAAARKRTVATCGAYVSCVVFPGTDRQLLAGGGAGGVALWDVEAGAALAAWPGQQAVLALDAAPGAPDVFASGGAEGGARVLDARVPRAVHSFDAHEGEAGAVRFHPGGDALATGGEDAALRLFDLRADRQLAEYRREAQLFAAHGVEWSLSGRLLFGAYADHTAAAWDALREARVAVLGGHEHRLSAVRRAPDGAALATASWDATVRIWA